MYHQPRTCSSPLTASRKVSSLRLPRVGARTRASAIASAGGLRVGPPASGAGTCSSPGATGSSAMAASYACPSPESGPIQRTLNSGPHRGHFSAHAEFGQRPVLLAADGPGAGAGGGVEERRSVVLLGLGSCGGVAAAPHRFPGAVVELVFAAVGAVGGDRRRVAAGLAGGDRFQRRDRDAAGQLLEGFFAFALPLAGGRLFFGADFRSERFDGVVEAFDRSLQRCDLRLANRGSAGGRLLSPCRERCGRKGEKDEQNGGEVFAFCEQAQNREGLRA